MSVGNLSSAAVYINNTLVTRGYLEDNQRIVFPSLNEEEGNENAEEEGETGDDKEAKLAIVKNDTRIINVIYGLLDSAENDEKDSEDNSRKLKELQVALERETQLKVRALARVKDLEKKVSQNDQKIMQLDSSLKLAKISHSDTKDNLVRLNQLVTQLKGQFANELRKRDVELSTVKERLRDPRRLKTHYGVKGILSKSQNSYKSIQTDFGSDNVDVGKISEQLVELNQKLVIENGSLLKTLYSIKSSLDTANNKLSALEEFEFNGPALDSAGVAKRIVRVDKLGSDITANLEQLYGVLNDPNFIPLEEVKEKDKKIEHLEEQLQETTENWKKALKTMDQWKSYRATRSATAMQSRTGKPSTPSSKSSSSHKPVSSTKNPVSHTVKPERSVSSTSNSLSTPTKASLAKKTAVSKNS